MVLAVVFGVIGVSSSGCGSSGASSGGSQLVASVDGVSITKASVEHWMRVESVLSYVLTPTVPAPKGVLPDPPSYAACIAWLGSARGPVMAHSLTAAQRKTECEQHLVDLRRKTVEFLVLYQWYVGEAKAEGITVPESEVRKNLARYIREEIPGKFQRYLSASGMSEADALFLQRLTAYGEKVKAPILAKPPSEARRALLQFTSKWVAKTSCQPGYVFPGCRQYRGSDPPP